MRGKQEEEEREEEVEDENRKKGRKKVRGRKIEEDKEGKFREEKIIER